MRRRGDESGLKKGRNRKKGVWRKDKIEIRKEVRKYARETKETELLSRKNVH